MHHTLPTDLASTLDDLSAPRLASYRNFFTPTTNQELYGIYCWNDAISIRFMRLIGIIEILMRNRFHRELSKFAHCPTSFGTNTSNNWYRYIVTDNTQTAKQLKKKSGNSLSSSVPAHQVIAGMTFGFWHNLLNIAATPSGLPIPWKTIIPGIFSDHPQKSPGHWKKEHHRDQLFARLAYVNDFRNRIAHFEPLWKFGNLKDEWLTRPAHPVAVVEGPPADVTNSLRRLKLCYDRCLQLLGWLSKDRAADYKRSENHFSLEWLFTKGGLDHYREIGKIESLRLGSLTKSWGAKLAITNGRAVVVTKKSQVIGMYVPTFNQGNVQ
jgi:Abi-like protein